MILLLGWLFLPPTALLGFILHARHQDSPKVSTTALALLPCPNTDTDAQIDLPVSPSMDSLASQFLTLYACR